jgi:hypothetical protein
VSLLNWYNGFFVFFRGFHREFCAGKYAHKVAKDNVCFDAARDGVAQFLRCPRRVDNFNNTGQLAVAPVIEETEIVTQSDRKWGSVGNEVRSFRASTAFTSKRRGRNRSSKHEE